MKRAWVQFGRDVNGKALKVARALKGLTVEEMALACGLSPRTIHELESDRRHVRPQELAKILRALSR